MDKIIVDQLFKLNQVTLAFHMIGQEDLAYCAMCDEVHINDSSCQRSE